MWGACIYFLGSWLLLIHSHLESDNLSFCLFWVVFARHFLRLGLMRFPWTLLHFFFFRGKFCCALRFYFSVFIILASFFIDVVSSLHFYYLGHLFLCSISFKWSLRSRRIIDLDFTLVALSFPAYLVFQSLLLILFSRFYALVG